MNSRRSSGRWLFWLTDRREGGETTTRCFGAPHSGVPRRAQRYRGRQPWKEESEKEEEGGSSAPAAGGRAAFRRAGGDGGSRRRGLLRQPAGTQCCPAAPARSAAHCCHGGAKMAGLAYTLGKREINYYFSVRTAKALALGAVLLLAACHAASRRYRGERGRGRRSWGSAGGRRPSGREAVWAGPGPPRAPGGSLGRGSAGRPCSLSEQAEARGPVLLCASRGSREGWQPASGGQRHCCLNWRRALVYFSCFILFFYPLFNCWLKIQSLGLMQQNEQLLVFVCGWWTSTVLPYKQQWEPLKESLLLYSWTWSVFLCVNRDVDPKAAYCWTRGAVVHWGSWPALQDDGDEALYCGSAEGNREPLQIHPPADTSVNLTDWRAVSCEALRCLLPARGAWIWSNWACCAV